MADPHLKRLQTVDDVCNFLLLRRLPMETINIFRLQKVDGQVVNKLSDDQLKEFGLSAIGDRIQLREICSSGRSISTQENNEGQVHVPDLDRLSEQRKGRRAELLDMLRAKNRPIRGTSGHSITSRGGRPRLTVRSFSIGVRMYTDGKRNVDGDRVGIMVKSPLGDKNTISVKINLDKDYNSVLLQLTQVVFPEGRNSVIGSLEDFYVEIVNFRNENVKCSVKGPFSFGAYIDQKKVSGTPKFYLLCSSLQYDEDDEDLEKESINIDHTVTERKAPVHEADDVECREAQLEDSLPDIPEVADVTELPGTPSGEVLFRIRNTIDISSDESVDQITSDMSEGTYTRPQDVSNKWATLKDCLQYTLHVMKHTSDPVEVLQFYEKAVHQGRSLETESECETTEGETLAVFVSRFTLWESGMEELMGAENLNYRLPLEVTFYGELAQDLGGPRREFLTLMMKEVLKEERQLFKKTVEGTYVFEETTANLRKKYYFGAGLLAGVSMLQQGPLPCFMEESQLQRIVYGEALSKSEQQFRDGLNCLGIVDLIVGKPCLLFLFRKTAEKDISYKQLLQLLKPQFSEPGSNSRQMEEETYSLFVCYLKEVAAGRRGTITLGSILQFVTGTEREPILGFQNQPSIQFSQWLPMSLPTAQTCVLQLTLPIGPGLSANRASVYEVFDLAFVNNYFGAM